MFRIKICGITTVDDALTAARAGADAVGLNFYPKSPRHLEPDEARRIVEALPPGVVKVGLFVNASPGDVCGTFDRLGLDLVQLHGDEPPDLLAGLGDRAVMRAFRVGREGLEPVAEYLRRCRGLGCLPRLVLLDSCVKGTYGGTGRVVDWRVAARYPSDDWHPPLVLAGGLTPDNVAEAIRAVRPAGVDTASGVESSPGRKDRALVERFVQSARQAFQGLP
ncbi:MAG TPA: phosphoribosylanthranilate isomerase [Thermoguttaceae bacterium]|nr:phosphoribosylanthranilate isomerase [Thermoguttaceae bacterium]